MRFAISFVDRATRSASLFSTSNDIEPRLSWRESIVLHAKIDSHHARDVVVSQEFSAWGRAAGASFSLLAPQGWRRSEDPKRKKK